jgi:hypothetical protein
MRKSRALLAALLFFLLSTPALAGFESALKNLAQDITQDFPSVRGRIIAVKGHNAMINIGRDKGVFPGMVFTVFRKGEPYYHPITKALLGYTEEELGTLQVIHTYPTASLGVLSTSQSARIKAGDGVRITASKINLYLFPLIDKTGEGFNLLAFTERLRTYLKRTGRFNIYGEERVILSISSASEGAYWEAFNKMVHNRKIQGAALLGAIIKDKGDYYFKSDLISLDTGKRIDSFYTMLGKGGWKPPVERDLLFASANWSDEGVALGVGDIDGDGREELLLAFKDRIDCFKVDVKTSSMKLISSLPVKARSRILGLDVVDLDGDKKAEVVLSLADETLFALRASILSFNSSKREWHHIVRGKESIIRGFNIEGEGLLLVQQISTTNPKSYSPVLARLVKGKIKKGKKLKGLKGDIICGAQLVDLNDDGGLEILVNEEGRLLLKNPLSGVTLWDTSGIFGNAGMAFFFRSPAAKSFYTGEEWLEEKDYTQYAEDVLTVAGRSIIFKNNGEYELAAFSNQPNVWGVHFSPFDRSQLILKKWKSAYFEDIGWNRRLQGGIMDIQAADMDGDGKKDLVILTKRGRKSREGSTRYYTRVMIYKVSE